MTDQKNTRPGAEHGSAAWGDVFRLNKFYMDKRGPNLLLTQHFHIGIDGYKHKHNTNILIVGGSGAGKTRTYGVPNVLECACSMVITDPKSEILRAIIIGFNVRPDNVAKEEAAATKVEMRMYRVIYDAINDVTDAMKGMLAPKYREVALGELQVRQVYKISNVGTVAGCRVTDGKITRDSKVRVVRDGIVLAEDEIASLKRFKDDAKEVAEGYECGVTLAKFADVKEGDVYEAFKMEEYRD